MTHTDTYGRPLGAKGERTRAAIIEAAKEMLGEIPLHNLTIKNIVDVAGLSTGTFWVYFAHIDDLVRELAKDANGHERAMLWAHQVRHAASVLKELTGQ